LTKSNSSYKYAQENWDNEVSMLGGRPESEVMKEIDAFYASLSSEDRKKLCFMNDLGHPYPSLLT